MARPALSEAHASFAVALALVFGVSPAFAAPPLGFRLEASVCPSSPLANDELPRALRAELEADGIHERVAGERSDVTIALDVSCDSVLGAKITLRSSDTERTLEHLVALGDTEPESRARTLALAVAEMVRADWPALSQRSEVVAGSDGARAAYPVVEDAKSVSLPPEEAKITADASTPSKSRASQAPAPATSEGARPSEALPRESSTRAVSPTRERFAWSAAARTRWFVDYASVSFGGELGADFGSMRLRVEALVDSANDALGTASLGSAALVAGYRVFEARAGAFVFSGYPELAFGATWLRGSPARSSVLSSPSTGIYADARFALDARLATSTVTPTFALEVGRAAGLVARAEDRVLAASGGFFLGATAGLRY